MLRITEINGFFVTALMNKNFTTSPVLFEKVYVGKKGLLGEIIAIKQLVYTIELYEKPIGVTVGEIVELSGDTFLAHLGPGLLGTVFNGIQKPIASLIESTSSFTENTASLNEEKKYDFIPIVQVGETVYSGQKIGYVDETNTIKHWILIPFSPPQNLKISYTIQAIQAGSYTVSQAIGKAISEAGKAVELTISQYWPVKVPKPIHARLQPKNLFQTGIRFVDGFFPIMQGCSVSVTESTQSKKIFIQNQLINSSSVNVLVYVGCNKSTNEVAQIIKNLRTEKSLTEKTVCIITQLNQPFINSKNAVYTGCTVAQYFRDMGYNVSLVIDSSVELQEINNIVYQCASVVKTCGSEETASITVFNLTYQPTLTNSEVNLVVNHHQHSQNYYPHINEQASFSFFNSQYQQLIPKMFENGERYIQAHKKAKQILLEERKLIHLTNSTSTNNLNNKDTLTIEIAKLIREGFLQQDATSKIDIYCQLIKMAAMLMAIIHVYNEVEELINQHPTEENLVENIFTAETKKIIFNLKYREKISEIKADEQILLARVSL